MQILPDTPAQVKDAVRADLRERHISLSAVSAMLGSVRSSFATTMGQTRSYFGRTLSTRLVNLFDYDYTYLHTGYGELRPSQHALATPADTHDSTRGDSPVVPAALPLADADLAQQVADLAQRVRRLEDTLNSYPFTLYTQKRR